MQSRLPDVNTAFNTHRKRAIIAIEQRRWTECLGAEYAINAALPEEYRVIISDQEYKKLTKQDLTVICEACKEQFDYDAIKILNVITTSFERLVNKNRTIRVWYCPKCKHEYKLATTEIEQSILKQPYYLGVVPKPPQRSDGIADHVTYDREFERWAWTMLDELEQKMAQYRDDNWDRGQDNLNQNMEIDTRWEESDDNN